MQRNFYCGAYITKPHKPALEKEIEKSKARITKIIL